MTVDPGYPFGKSYEAIIEDLENRIRYGVEQPGTVSFLITREQSAFPMPRAISAIDRVSGVLEGEYTVFRPRQDYTYDPASNRLQWVNLRQLPDTGLPVTVDYIYRERPAGLTDFNPGSVVGTLMRALAREFKLIYAQMDEAYRRAFIDQATGYALDNVVALLGISRNPATHAEGEVEFRLDSATGTDVTIPANTVITDQSGREYITLAAGTIPGTEEVVVTPLDTVINMPRRVGAVLNARSETGDDLALVDTADDAPYGSDSRTITLAQAVSGRVTVSYQPLSVRVPVQAVQPGPDGNVNPGAITLMPDPPTGIDSVINPGPIEGGAEPENDERLRERAKNALERSGNATLNAIKYAVLDVDGVEAVEVIDHSQDDSIPLGEIFVRYSGGDPSEVHRAVQATRAAGVMARLEQIRTTYIRGRFYVVPAANVSDFDLNNALATFQQTLITALEQVAVSEPVNTRRLGAGVFSITGLADAAESQLYPVTEAAPETYPENIIAQKGELLRPDPIASQVRVLAVRRLAVESVRRNQSIRYVRLQLLDNTGAVITFSEYPLDLNVTLRAAFRNGQGEGRVTSFVRRVTFSGEAVAALRLDFKTDGSDTSDLPNRYLETFADTLEVEVTAAAYPGILGARVSVPVV